MNRELRKEGGRRNLLRDFVYTTIMCILGICFYLWIGWIGFKVQVQSIETLTSPVKPKWYVEELGRNLSQQIIGQKQAIEDLMEIVDNSNNENKYQLVFLLGGPGVGKSYVTRIMKDHAGCENDKCYFSSRKWPMKKQLSYCDPQYFDKSIIFAEDEIKDFKFLINDINNKTFANYYKKEMNCLKTNDKKGIILMVSGELVTEEDLQTFYYASEYMEYVNTAAQKLESYMWRHEIPEVKVTVVVFKPLKSHQVRWCLKQQYTKCHRYMDDDLDFVPLGCKISVEC